MSHDAETHAREAVGRLDLTKVALRLEKTFPGDPERITEAIEEYRRFLYLAIVHPDAALIPPTPDVDEAWHNHILYTVQYAEDCQALFGEFFHHQPGEGEMPMDLYEETLNLYQSSFGERPRGKLWTEEAA